MNVVTPETAAQLTEKEKLHALFIRFLIRTGRISEEIK